MSFVANGKREQDELRRELAEVDSQIVALLDRRARAARRVGEVQGVQPPGLPLTDPSAVAHLVSHSSGDMPDEPLREILAAIFAACLALESPTSVALAGGVDGPAFGAARGRFGPTAALHQFETTASALEAVSHRKAEFAVVPLESSAEGPLADTIQALVASDLRVVELLETTRIRFAVAGTRPSRRVGSERTSFAFSVHGSPASLLDVLHGLAERGIPLLKIHTCPLPGAPPWSYLFYAETTGHFTDRPLVTAFEEIKRMTRFFRVLGSYPA